MTLTEGNSAGRVVAPAGDRVAGCSGAGCGAGSSTGAADLGGASFVAGGGFPAVAFACLERLPAVNISGTRMPACAAPLVAVIRRTTGPGVLPHWMLRTAAIPCMSE